MSKKNLHPTATKSKERRFELLALSSFTNHKYEGHVKRGQTFFATAERKKQIDQGSVPIAKMVKEHKARDRSKKGGGKKEEKGREGAETKDQKPSGTTK